MKQHPKRGAPVAVDLSMLLQLLSFHVRMLSLEVNRAYDRAFADTPLAGGTGKLTTLMLVATNPGISQSEVGVILSKDRPAMVRLVNHLEQAGLILRRRPSDERRRYGLFLTPKARASVAQYMRLALDYDDGFFAILSAREKADLSRILRKMRRVYQAETLAVERAITTAERAAQGNAPSPYRNRPGRKASSSG